MMKSSDIAAIRSLGRTWVPVLLAGLLLSCNQPMDPGSWGNPLDSAGGNYHPPTVALRDTSFRTVGSVIVAQGASANSVIAKYAWTVGGTTQANSSDSISTAGWATGSYTVAVRVTDGNGLTSSWSTATVWIGDRPPTLAKKSDTALSANSTLTETLSATDADGTVTYYAWDTANTGFGNATTTGTLTLSATVGGTKTVRWKAVDNDSGASLDTFKVGFVPAPSSLSMTVDCGLVSWNSTKKTGTLVFSWSGSITGFSSEAITWTLYAGTSSGNLSQIYSGTKTSDSVSGVDSGVTYSYRLVGKNRFGDSSVVTGAVVTTTVSNDSSGTFIDSRDNQTYKWVKIGTQVWMAQNLSYAGSGTTIGVCYNNLSSNCTTYGRMYTWAEAMGVSTTYNSTLLSPTLPAQGICPSGWHVPSDAEWTKLTDTTLSSATAGTVLKSTSGWSSGNGTDVYGFRVLPAGYLSGGLFLTLGSNANFLSASEYNASRAWYRSVGYGDACVYRNGSFSGDGKSDGLSLRCLKN